jgi:hypothetical protein
MERETGRPSRRARGDAHWAGATGAGTAAVGRRTEHVELRALHLQARAKDAEGERGRCAGGAEEDVKLRRALCGERECGGADAGEAGSMRVERKHAWLRLAPRAPLRQLRR